MKEYRKDIKGLYWLLVVMGVIGTRSVYFEEWFQWSTKLYFGLCAFLLPLLAISPLKYFCGIVSLRVSNKAIERVWMIFKTCTISRENAVLFSRSILGIYCMIFSNSDLSRARTVDILYAALKHQAIVFPYVYQIKQDFPEWFD